MHLSQILADAAPLAHREDQNVARLVLVQSATLVQKAQRVENLRSCPPLRVVVAGPLVDKDDCVLGDTVAIYRGVRRGAVGDGDGNETGVAHYFIDEGHHIRQSFLIFDGGQLCALDHLVHFISQALLYLRIPAGEMKRDRLKRL